MKKNQIILIIIFMFTSSANALEKLVSEGNIARILIKNNVGFVFSDSRVYISNTTGWLPLGVIGLGENDFRLPYENVERENIIQLKYPNGQWVSGVVKRLDSKTIILEINREFNMDNVLQWNMVSIPGTTPSFIENRTQPDCMEFVPLYPIRTYHQ
ncbi:hypothetical protein ACR2R9_004318 [Cronobacter sakazakii]